MPHPEAEDLSFERLHAEYAPRVRAYLCKFVDAYEAEDLTQEVFLKVHRGLNSFRREAKVSTWIFQIATHRALFRLRSPHSALSCAPSADEVVEPAAPSHAYQPLHAEMGQCSRDLIETLPMPLRVIIHLGELKELKLGEIAQVLEISPGAAKIRLHRARKALRDRMEADCRILLDERAELQCDRKALVPDGHRDSLCPGQVDASGSATGM